MKFAVNIAALLVAVLAGTAASAEGRVPVPHPPEPADAEKCVERTDVMRRNHMEFILHQRDETMRQGIRGSKHSLKDCINCHVVKDETGQPVTIQSEKHFCNSCHRYAAVKIDCFQCHASTPAPGPNKGREKTAHGFGSVIKAPAGESP